MRKPANIIAAFGLVLGGVLGMVGTMVAQQNVRAIAWGIDGTALVVATCLLALRYFRKGNDCVAAGFLVYPIGEGVMLGGTAGSLEASVPSFAAGTALWTRTTSIVGGVLFAIVAGKIFFGQQVLPTTSPLPYFAYPFLVLTFAGWFVTLLKAD